MRHLTIIIALCALFVGPIGCGKSQETTAQDPPAMADSPEKVACATCAKGKAGENLWCDDCNAGYVGGEKTGCQSCFEGKTGESVWCEGCGAGYVAGDKTTCQSCYQAKLGGPACETCSK